MEQVLNIDFIPFSVLLGVVNPHDVTQNRSHPKTVVPNTRDVIVKLVHWIVLGLGIQLQEKKPSDQE